MRLGLTDDQEAIREVFGGFFAREAPISAVREAEPLGFSGAMWSRLCETGAPGMGVAESDGGGGASLADLAVVAERAGAALAPVPFVDHTAAARVLASIGGLSADVVDGQSIASLALRPARAGVWALVPSGAVAHVVIGLDGDSLVCVRSDPPAASPRNHGAQPIADRSSVDGARVVIASGATARTAFDQAVAEWKTLTAAALVGLSQQALDIGVQYAKERIQFGRPIGAFQAVQQGLADLPGMVDGGRLLANKAAWAGDRLARGIEGSNDVDRNDNTDFETLAGMAFVFCADTAAWVTDRSLHYHGGYGYAEEYDIQLFYRRARGWALIWDDPSRECLRVADRLFGPRKGAA